MSEWTWVDTFWVFIMCCIPIHHRTRKKFLEQMFAAPLWLITYHTVVFRGRPDVWVKLSSGLEPGPTFFWDETILASVRCFVCTLSSLTSCYVCTGQLEPTVALMLITCLSAGQELLCKNSFCSERHSITRVHGSSKPGIEALINSFQWASTHMFH